VKIAIITIATEEYRDNIPVLKRSIEKYFLPRHSKTVFLFTNGFPSVHDICIEIDHLPWPLITLMRFNYILKIKYTLSQYDMIYYIDSDCEVVDTVGEEIFPDSPGQITATQHPWQGCDSTIYETNPFSKAAVLDNQGRHYFQGCFFGGYSKAFLEMAAELHTDIVCDLKSNFIAKWHDESHLNRYLVAHPPKELHMGYAYPGDRWKQTFPVEKKIVHGNLASPT
jgi:hypothetical protein